MVSMQQQRLEHLAHAGDVVAQERLEALLVRTGERLPLCIEAVIRVAASMDKPNGSTEYFRNTWRHIATKIEITPEQTHDLLTELKRTHERTHQDKQWGINAQDIGEMIEEAISGGHEIYYRSISAKELSAAYKRGYGGNLRDQRCVAVVAVRQRAWLYVGAVKVDASGLSHSKLIPNLINRVDSPGWRKRTRRALASWCRHGWRGPWIQSPRGKVRDGIHRNARPTGAWTRRFRLIKGAS